MAVPGQPPSGSITTNTWYRIGIVVSPLVITYYINGQLVGFGRSDGVDGRYAMSPAASALLLGSANTNAARGYVNSIQLRDVALSRGQMMALGGPSAAGLPQTLPPVPSYLENWTPSGSLASRDTAIGAVINRGDTTINTGTISLKLDGTPVAEPQITTVGSIIAVLKSNLPPLTLNTQYTLELSYTDSNVRGLSPSSFLR